jgi:hypothetical protein
MSVFSQALTRNNQACVQAVMSLLWLLRVQRRGAERKSARSFATPPFAPTQLPRQIFAWINVHHEWLDAIVRALQEVPAVALDVKVGKLGVSWDHRWHLN